MEDYYEILGVVKEANAEEIKKAYKRQALLWHPDKHSHSNKTQASDKFKLILEAYEVLSNTDKRYIFDQYGHQGLKSGLSKEDLRKRKQEAYAQSHPYNAWRPMHNTFEDFFSSFDGGVSSSKRYRQSFSDSPAESFFGFPSLSDFFSSSSHSSFLNPFHHHPSYSREFFGNIPSPSFFHPPCPISPSSSFRASPTDSAGNLPRGHRSKTVSTRTVNGKTTKVVTVVDEYGNTTTQTFFPDGSNSSLGNSQSFNTTLK